MLQRVGVRLPGPADEPADLLAGMLGQDACRDWCRAEQGREALSRSAKVGDFVRSRRYPGVGGIVTAIEDTDKFGVIYRTKDGFWLPAQVTVELPIPESQDPKQGQS